MALTPTTHPILVGIDNPWSDRPEDVLAPVKPGCTGHNLLKILQLADPSYTPERFYEDFPERVNLKDVGSTALLNREDPSVFVAFGQVVGATMARIPGIHVKPLTSVKRGLHVIHFVPHPSGVNRWYNDPMKKLATGRYLLDLRGSNAGRNRS